MGTTLSAIVETFYPSVQLGTSEPPLRTVARWSQLGTWEFNKDYPLSIYLNENAQDGWPIDSDCYDDSRRGGGEHEFHDTGRQWCDAETVEAALIELSARKDDDNIDEAAPHTLTLEALVAALQVLRREDVKVRVMWYRS